MNDPTNDRFGELSTQAPTFLTKLKLSKQEKCHWLILLVQSKLFSPFSEIMVIMVTIQVTQTTIKKQVTSRTVCPFFNLQSVCNL